MKMATAKCETRTAMGWRVTMVLGKGGRGM
jgi:hypothetical protein